MTDVIVPELSGLLCAEGLLRAQTQANFSHTLLMPTAEGLGAVAPIFRELTSQAEEWLDREHVETQDRELRYAIDMRYEGQNHELTVPLSSSAVPSRDALEDAFHAIHEESYGYADKQQPTMLVTFRLTALGRLAHRQPSGAPQPESPSERAERRRPVYFDAREPADTLIVSREALTPSVEYRGPLIVEQMDTTTVVPPDATATLLPSGNLRIAIADTSKGDQS
jgi:N-methylhydantoinase A